jgi:hypothetical protein
MHADTAAMVHPQTGYEVSVSISEAISKKLQGYLAH